MCGITGFIDFQSGVDSHESAIKQMTEKLNHRGPNDKGQWLDGNAGVVLGHSRLAIIDLTSDAHQPMVSPTGRYVIAYNGEIYNYRQLPGANDIDSSAGDTAHLLAAIEAVGIKSAIEQSNGMFALAVWDKAENRLYLARDRMGIKPLYYGWHHGNFLFGSELKAIYHYPGFRIKLNRDAVALQMRYNYIPTPYTIDERLFKLWPGQLLSIDRDNRQTHTETFWSVKDVAEKSKADPLVVDDSQARQHLEQLLRMSVKRRMVADVPVGAFLSGGIDSSTVAALMQSQAHGPIKTFSIGFHDSAHNEAPHAKAIADHLGTDHTELYVRQDDALGLIPQMPYVYDEPFSDASQLPTYLISRLARKDVTVSLSGDGGDELFCGYDRYLVGNRLHNKIKWMPALSRQWLGTAMFLLSRGQWDRLARLVPGRKRFNRLGEKVHKLASALKNGGSDELYRHILSHWKRPSELVLSANEPVTAFTDKSNHPDLDSFLSKMMYIDSVTYLADDILTKVDRASMAVSLEARVPLLDHEVVEFAWRCPQRFKYANGQGKWLLRQVLYEYVPRELIERPKMGFGVPLATWLRGSLKEWGEDLLSYQRLQNQGIFNVDLVRQAWQEHQAGRQNWEYHLWDVLMFQSWYDAWYAYLSC